MIVGGHARAGDRNRPRRRRGRPWTAGEAMDGFGEGTIVDMLDKGDRVAAAGTPATIPNVFFGADQNPAAPAAAGAWAGVFAGADALEMHPIAQRRELVQLGVVGFSHLVGRNARHLRS